MKVTLEEAAKMLLENDNIVILSHEHPDGDTLGCAYALKIALNSLGKKVKALCADEPSKKYSYMFQGIENDDFDDERFVVSVDVADDKLLGDTLQSRYMGKIDLVIDHHASNKLGCKFSYVDPSAAAACEIIYELLQIIGIPIDKKIADCLYTGLSTDTGCFRYSNTTARTLKMAAELVELGADNFYINTVMFETKSRTYMRLETLVMEKMQMYFDDKCCLAYITRDMYEKSGSNENETDPIASKTRQIEGVLVGVTLREKADGSFKVSVRTNGDLDASEICACLGGGGHPKASGCQVDGPLEEAKRKMLDVVKKFL